MEPSICKICGSKHWGVVHVWANTKPEVPKPAGQAPAIKPAPKFDRVAYQREYMRRRRAKKP